MRIKFILQSSGNQILTELDMPVLPVGLLLVEGVYYEQVGDAVFVVEKNNYEYGRPLMLSHVMIVVKKADNK